MTCTTYDNQRKELLKEIEHQEYDVSQMYKEDSVFARIATSGWFFLGSTVLVVMNAVWLGVEEAYSTEDNLYKEAAIFILMENLFCICFACELGIRFGAFERKTNCIKDSWFSFDATLVILMMMETWIISPILIAKGGANDVGTIAILRVARCLRLTKIGRIGRVLRSIPDLLAMVKGITRAMRSVLFTVILLLAFCYFFAIIIFTQSEGIAELQTEGPDGTMEGVFHTLEETFWVLLLQGTFLDDIKGLMDTVKQQSTALAFLLLVFILGSSFTLMNMLIAIICEVAADVSRREKDQSAVTYLRANLMDILEVHDKDSNKQIAKSEFELLMRNPEMRMILTNFGVDPEDLLSLEDVLFEDKEGKEVASLLGTASLQTLADDDVQAMMMPLTHGKSLLKEVSFADFLERVMRLRGGNCASVRDVVELREYLRKSMDHLEATERSRARPSQCIAEDSYVISGVNLPTVEMLEKVSQSPEYAVAAAENSTCSQPSWVAELRDEARSMKKRLIERERTEGSMLARIDELREEVRAVSSRLDILEHPNVLTHACGN